ncbi:MAG: alpha/beta hydrolase [Anaerolineae bacterium]
MQEQQFTWRAHDGVEFFARDWHPAEEASALVCLVHGLGEHSGRYAHVAAHLCEAGVAMTALDLRGHGRSGGPRGHAPTYDTLMDDIARFLALSAERYPARPCFLYGHSLGGNLALNYALRRQPSLAGVIASAPGLRAKFQVPGWKLALGQVLYNVWPSFSMASGLDRVALAREGAVVRAYEADPLVHGRVSARLGLDTIKSGEWALRNAERMHLPLLLMHGDADAITDAEASREFARLAGACCSLVIWQGFFHEIHNEAESGRVMDAIVTFIRQQIADSAGQATPHTG